VELEVQEAEPAVRSDAMFGLKVIVGVIPVFIPLLKVVTTVRVFDATFTTAVATGFAEGARVSTMKVALEVEGATLPSGSWAPVTVATEETSTPDVAV
jgi:hypothetical protein